MKEEEMLKLNGKELFTKLVKANREGNLTPSQIKDVCQKWLYSRGLFQAKFGWMHRLSKEKDKRLFDIVDEIFKEQE